MSLYIIIENILTYSIEMLYCKQLNIEDNNMKIHLLDNMVQYEVVEETAEFLQWAAASPNATIVAGYTKLEFSCPDDQPALDEFKACFVID